MKHAAAPTWVHPGRRGIHCGSEVLDRHLGNPRQWVRMQPRCCPQRSIDSRHLAEQLLPALRIGGIAPELVGRHALAWVITLGALQKTTIGHDASVAHGTRPLTYLNRSFLANHIASEGHDAVRVYRDAELLVANWISDRLHAAKCWGVKGDRRIKDYFPSLDPLHFAIQLRRVPVLIPDDDRLLLLQPIQIARRLAIGCVDRVALINRPNRDAVVIIGGGVFRRSRRIRQRQFQGGHRRVIPSSWDRRPPAGLLGYLANAGYGCADHLKSNENTDAHTGLRSDGLGSLYRQR